jgi:hypothetical protein
LARATLLSILAFTAILLPQPGRGQIIFDWPVRAAPQPEAVLTGAGAVFWNPGSLSEEVGTGQEFWITHVDGPEETGVGGVALAGVVDLPLGLRGGFGYWHLGTGDIPRTIDSPAREPGDISVSEDVGILGLARDLGRGTGVGAALRLQRGSAPRDARNRLEGEIGIHHQANWILQPRLGLSIRGLGRKPRTLGGVEVALPPLASARIPVRVGYGLQVDRKLDPLEHRFSLRASWMEEFHAGIGLNHLDRGGEWTPLWMAGADMGRYSLSIMREALANGFGAIHFFRASVRFP